MEIAPLDQAPLNHSSPFLQREGWTRQQVEDYQARALQICRAYAYTHSPFYQRFHQGLMDCPLQELPVLTKNLMMEHFDEFVTDRAVHLQDVQRYLAKADASTLFLNRYQVMATSGSTGRPGIFLTNPAEGADLTDSFTRFELWGGLTLESRVAVIGSSASAHMSTQFPLVLNGQRVPRLQLSSNDLLETLVQRLNEFQPEMLFSYPTIASVLANEQRQGRLHIAPRFVSCGAEPLPSEMRRRMEETWQTKIFDVYATTEGGVLASECEFHEGMHLFTDFSILEVVDQNNRLVPPGEQGDKVLLTSLFRRTQPLIRYEITDKICLSTRERCPCGRPFALFETIKGRKGDMLYLLSSTGKEEGITTLQFQTVFDRQPVTGWQVVQELDGLHIFLTGTPEELRDEDVLDALRQMLIRRGVIVPTIEIHRVTTLTTTATGKALVLISRVPRRPTS